MKRIMGIDYGDARVGVAISDPLGITAQALPTIQNKSKEVLFAELKKYLNEYNPSVVVIGLPKNMNNSLGFRAEKTFRFRDELAQICDAELVLSDERLTTVIAHKAMNDGNVRGKKRKDAVDSIAAILILQNYLDSHQ